MFNESNINCFLSLAETLSFKKTAFMMAVSQQAVSQVISRMEAKLGVKLFVRSKRHVEITPIGQEFYDFFSRYKEEYDQLCVKAKKMASNSAGSIRIGYQNWIDYGIEPKLAIDEIRKEIPEFETFVTRRSPGALVQSLLNKDLDIVVMFDQFAPRLSELKIAPLMGMELEIIVSAEHPLAVPGTDYMAFSTDPFVFDVFENESEVTAKRRMKNVLDNLGFKPSQLVLTQDLEAVYNAVEHQSGVALSSSISRVVRSYNIKRFPTGRKDTLVCVSQLTGGNELIDKYVDALQQAYVQTGRA